MAAYLQEFGQMARPALAQAAQTYGPAVVEGVKKGVKEGIISLRNPQKASKYYSINSVEDLAKAPGNISAMIDENLSAAAARSTSQTPFLNTFAGPGAGDKLHQWYYGNGKPTSPQTRKAVLASTALSPSAATQARWQELSAQKPVRYGENVPPELRPRPTFKPARSGPELQGGKRKTQKKRKTRQQRGPRRLRK